MSTYRWAVNGTHGRIYSSSFSSVPSKQKNKKRINKNLFEKRTDKLKGRKLLDE